LLTTSLQNTPIRSEFGKLIAHELESLLFRLAGWS
jgi:hypothetical protein